MRLTHAALDAGNDDAVHGDAPQSTQSARPAAWLPLQYATVHVWLAQDTVTGTAPAEADCRDVMIVPATLALLHV